MRYVIVGAGAVEGAIGGRLHQGGHRVVLVARGAHLDRIRADGLRLVTPEADERLEVPVAGGPEELQLSEDDVLVLATKSQHTSEALGTWWAAEVATAGGGSRPAGAVLTVLCAQNGIANEPNALRWFARVAGVAVWLPAGMPEPGTVVAPCAPLTGQLHLGPHPVTGSAASELAPVLEAVAADLESSRFAAPRPPEVMAWKRLKLLSKPRQRPGRPVRPRRGVAATARAGAGRGPRGVRGHRLGGGDAGGGGSAARGPDGAAGDPRARPLGRVDVPEPGPRGRLGRDRLPERRDQPARTPVRRADAGEHGPAAAGGPRGARRPGLRAPERPRGRSSPGRRHAAGSSPGARRGP